MMIMVLKFCPPSQLHLSINQVPINEYSPDKVPDGRPDRRTKRRIYAFPFGEHNNIKSCISYNNNMSA